MAGTQDRMATSEIPKTMLAWRKRYTSKEPTRDEVPVPSVEEDSILVKIHAAGVCHSDLAILDSDAPPPGFRHTDTFTLGHEGCGEVVATGSKVTSLNPGDMVAILAVPGCRESTCAECSKGIPQVCATGHHYGLDMDGSFAPYVAVKATAAIKLPPGVGAAAAAVATDAITTAYHAVVGRAQVVSGETVLLYGLGGLGFNALQILQSIGARVIAVDKRQAVLDEAVKFGVAKDDILSPGTEDVADWISRRGLIIDKAIDFVGVQESFSTAVNTVRCGGKIVLVGLYGHALTLASHSAIFKHIDILGSYGGTVEDTRSSLGLIATGVVTPQVEVERMANLPQVLHDLHGGKIKSRVAVIPEGAEAIIGLERRSRI